MKPSRCLFGLALACLGLLNCVTPLQAAEPPWAPGVIVLALDPAAAEQGPDAATFLVVRVGRADEPLTVQYTVGGSALNGTDYVFLPGTVTIPKDAWLASITVDPIDDTLREETETVVLALEQPAQWPPPYHVMWPGVAAVEIADNDSPPTNRPPEVELNCPPNGAIFLAGMDIPLVARASDADGMVETVEFFDGDNHLGTVTNQPIFVFSTPIELLSLDQKATFDLEANLFPTFNEPACSEPFPETYSRFRMIWRDAPPGLHVLTAVATDNKGASTVSAPVNITVLDVQVPPILTIRAADPTATEPEPHSNVVDTATFKIHRTGPTNQPLQFWYQLSGTASNGVDYQELPKSFVIPAGRHTLDVTILPLDDALVEGTETVVMKLVPPLCGAIFPPPPDCYLVGLAHSAKAFILDNDTLETNRPPVVRLVQPREGELFLAPANIRLVARAQAYDGDINTIEFFEGTRSLGIITNAPVHVGIPWPPFTLVWSNAPRGDYVLTAVATDDKGAVSQSPPVEIQVVSDAWPPVVNLVPLDTEAAETLPTEVPNRAVFSVTRNGETQSELTVYYSVSGTAENGVDYKPLQGWVVIPAGASSNSIVIEPIDDSKVEGPESIVVKLEGSPIIWGPNPGPGPTYLLGTNTMGLAILLDNDGDTNCTPKLQIVHPADGAVIKAGSDLEMDVLACDPDGWVNSVQFYAGTNLIGQQSVYFLVPPPPGQPQKFSMVWSKVPAGEYELTAKATDNAGGVAVSVPVKIKVVSAPALPEVTISAIDPIGTEPDPRFPMFAADPAVFRVTRTGSLDEPLTVYYRLGGTAQNGIDYARLSGQVTLKAQGSSALIPVLPLEDSVLDPLETVIVTLVPWSVITNIYSPGAYIVGSPAAAMAYIREFVVPPGTPPTVAIVSPPNGAIYTAPVEVRLVAAAQASGGWVDTVEFFDGPNSLGVVTNECWVLGDPPDHVPGVGPGLLPDLLPQIFSLVWSNVPPGNHALTAVATDCFGESWRSHVVTVTVLKPGDTPIVSIAAIDPIAREGTSDTALFRVLRSGPTNSPLTVYYSAAGTASNGVDYVQLPGAVTIPAGKRAARIAIQPIEDTFPERVETVVLRLVPTPDGTATYQIGRPARATAVILDNDQPALTNVALQDGSLHLRLPVPLGMPFRLEASSDLVNWEPVLDGVASETGVSIINDPQTEGPQRFFRLVQEFSNVESD